MIDIGVNFTNKRFDIDRPAVLARAKNAGLEALIITGTNIDESQKALALCREYSGYLYCTAGVHPHDADHVSHDYLEKIYELAQNFEIGRAHV